MRARSTPPKLKKRAPQVGGFAAHFACGFFEFWRGGTRSRIVFLEVFARGPLITAHDNMFSPILFCLVTFLFSHILFSHICLGTFRGLPPSRGVPVVRDGRFDRFFEKNTTKNSNPTCFSSQFSIFGANCVRSARGARGRARNAPARVARASHAIGTEN